ncbi:MAG: winged helix-turn-helix transcriptional regulator [Chloroflexi bacterium]|nr:winged helix-turn-helix transcriptional regulator [Chloroflexota bacterium]MBI3760927.1 winged helix-turn-helix transcriptional regulator [Chloroflexota bacterium]
MPSTVPAPTGTAHELKILEQLETDPDLTQAGLATRLGVAVGTINWYLKRLVAKGYVKAQRLDRKRLRYIVTRQGITLRSRLTVQYLQRTMQLYRDTREESHRLLEQVRRAGFKDVRLEGDGEIADIFRLTALELGFGVVTRSDDGDLPVVAVRGTQLELRKGDNG